MATKSKITKPKGRARNGSGTISPRETATSGTVYDAWTPSIKDPQTGKSRRIPKRGFATQQAAQEWINATVAGIKGGQKVRERRGGITVDEVVEVWAKASTLKKTTIAGYRRTYEWLAQKEIGHEVIARLRGTDIDLLLATLRHRHTAATISLLCKALVSIWDFAYRAGETDANYAKESPWVLKIYAEVRAAQAEKRQRMENGDKSLVKVFTPGQSQTFLAMERREDYRRFWEFILGTGARRGEALGLRWIDVDLEEGTVWLSENHTYAGGQRITAETPKSNRRRCIPIAPGVVELLREQQAYLERQRERWGDRWKEHGLVFPRAAIAPRAQDQCMGGHQDPQAVTEAFSNRCRRYGLPQITLHGLRHTYATALLRQGVDIKTIQKLLGHRLDITTLVYTHTDADTQREATIRAVDYLSAT